MNKHLYLLIPTFFYFIFGAATPLSSQTPTATIATWKDNKKAAYTIIHDDFSNYVTSIYQTAAPIATSKGVKICFGAITNFCGAAEWANARNMIANGHECVNHSHNHRCGGAAGECTGLTTYSVADFATELGQSTQIIEANTGVKPRFFIHPYDVYTPEVLNYLTGLGYIGSRSGARSTLNGSSFTDFMHLNFHVLTPTSLATELNQVVDQAISSGGYAVRELHGVADATWGAPSVQTYTNHLEYVRTQMNNGNIWSATASEAITYKMQRDAYQPNATYSAANGTITVSFNTIRNIDPSLLKTPITLNINLNGIAGVFNVTQNGASIPSVNTGNMVTVNVYPNKGSVVLNCSGCGGGTTPPNGSLDITKLTATPQTNAATINWANPTTPFSDVLVAVKEGSGFTTKPATLFYTANPNFAGNGTSFEGGKVVYQGAGLNVNVTGLTAGRTYYVRVYTRNGTVWSNGVETSVVPSGTTGGGTGNTIGCLQAAYYSNLTFSGVPVATRYETSVNYNWGTGKPNVTGIGADNFSIRWTGNFVAPQTGYFQFTTRADDGVRLWINNSLIINKWFDQAATSYSGYIYLVKGATYNIKLEYYERGGNSSVQLSWAVPFQYSQIMPFSANCGAKFSASSSDLITLNGRLDNSKAALQWVVNTKKPVDYYQIEKMDAQGEFKPLSIVNDNNQSVIRLFNFIDDKLTEGDNNYRIQTVFADNTPPQYSEALHINYLKSIGYNIFPNPARDFAEIDLSEAEGKAVRIHVYSLIGKELLVEKIQSASKVPHPLNISNWEAGQYLIRIETEGKKAVTRKLVIGN